MTELSKEGVYLKLFHGRKTVDEDMDSDWGEQGPILGPLDYVHTTYAATIHCLAVNQQYDVDLTVVEDCIYYNGWFYGDWSVTTAAQLQSQTDMVEQIDEAKAKVPPKS